MIRAEIRKDEDGRYTGFHIEGHAMYADRGKDIVCSAVSVLAINTVNSIENLTDNRILAENAKSGALDVSFPEGLDEAGELLMQSFCLGLEGIQEEYGSYLKIKES